MPRANLTPVKSALLALALARAVRIWCFLAVPLVITNDGAGYLAWGLELAKGQAAHIPPYRTPGYPGFLAALFALFGPGPHVVAAAQHLLVALACAALALIISRASRPAWGLALGALAALDPMVLGFTSYALSEQLSLVLLTAAAAVAILLTARPLLAAPVLGGEEDEGELF